MPKFRAASAVLAGKRRGGHANARAMHALRAAAWRTDDGPSLKGLDAVARGLQVAAAWRGSPLGEDEAGGPYFLAPGREPSPSISRAHLIRRRRCWSLGRLRPCVAERLQRNSHSRHIAPCAGTSRSCGRVRHSELNMHVRLGKLLVAKRLVLCALRAELMDITWG